MKCCGWVKKKSGMIPHCLRSLLPAHASARLTRHRASLHPSLHPPPDLVVISSSLPRPQICQNWIQMLRSLQVLGPEPIRQQFSNRHHLTISIPVYQKHGHFFSAELIHASHRPRTCQPKSALFNFSGLLPVSGRKNACNSLLEEKEER